MRSQGGRHQLHESPADLACARSEAAFGEDITEERIRRGAFKSVAELETAIQEYLDHHDADPNALRLGRHGDRYPRKSRTRAPSVSVGTLASSSATPCSGAADSAPPDSHYCHKLTCRS